MCLSSLSELRSLKLIERGENIVPAACEILRSITSELVEELSFKDVDEGQERWPEFSALLNDPRFLGMRSLTFKDWFLETNESAARSFLERQFSRFVARGILHVHFVRMPALRDVSDDEDYDDDY